MTTVAHLTSTHARFDQRIFVKECRFLAQHGYDVSLVVADGLGSAVEDRVRIHDAGRYRGTLRRLWHGTRRLFERGADLHADIYHLHDPELIPVGLRLKRRGRTVILDVHQDLPLQLLGTPYVPRLARQAMAAGAGAYQRLACAGFDGIVTATPSIRDKFLGIHANTVDVIDYPATSEFAPAPWADKSLEVCHVGSIAATSGIRELVAACRELKSAVRLNLAGQFEYPALEADVRGMHGWSRVNRIGHVNRAAVAATLRRSIAGLVTPHPQLVHLDALPARAFEYMAAGIPVIASDFPLWRAIVEKHHCGLCVNPLDAGAIANAVDFVATHPLLAQQMGSNGRRAVEQHYNWQQQGDKLLSFYGRLRTGAVAESRRADLIAP